MLCVPMLQIRDTGIWIDWSSRRILDWIQTTRPRAPYHSLGIPLYPSQGEERRSLLDTIDGQIGHYLTVAVFFFFSFIPTFVLVESAIALHDRHDHPGGDYSESDPAFDGVVRT